MTARWWMLGCAGLCVLLSACEGGRDRVLVVYSPLPADLLEFVEETFEDRHPEVNVRMVAFSDEAAMERLGDRSADQADVWWGASGTVLTDAANEGLLDSYRPSWADRSSVGDVDAEDRWHAVLASPFVIAFNRDELSLGEAPRDWIDVYHYKWRTQVWLLDPLFDPDMADFIGATLVQYLRERDDLVLGFDWLLRLDATVGSYTRNLDDIVIGLGNRSVLLTILPRHRAEEARADRAPWLFYRFPESGTPMLGRGVAVLAGAEDGEMARSFVEFVGTAEVATRAKLETRWSPVSADVEAAELPEDFEIDIPWTAHPFAFDTLAAELPGWLERWEGVGGGRGRAMN